MMGSAPTAPQARNWLVTGAGGLLGTTLVPTLRDAGHHVVALTRTDLDITDRTAVVAALATHRPDVVVNAAAYTAVDDAESHEEEALRINGIGPAVLAGACADAESLPVLLHVSTDYVFAGDGTAPYAEDAPTEPRTAYGRTKLAGEEEVRTLLPDRGHVVRTAWLYGPGGGNFVSTMLRLEGEKDTLDVVDDQRGQPTSTLVLSRLLLELGELAAAGQAPAGIHHGTTSGETTWFGLTREIFRLIGADPERVRPTTSAAFVRPAPRPAYSVLGHDGWARLGLSEPPHWRDALAEALPLMRS
jgi:dTDP-4-dehydrorhamnose reductase